MESSLPLSSLIHLLPFKLSSTNFLSWKTQVQTVLESEGLFGYLDGSLARPSASSSSSSSKDSPSSDSSAMSDASWVLQDKRLQSLLRSTLSEDIMKETIGCSSAKQIWDCLCSIFQNSSLSNELQLRDQLTNLRRGSGSVDDLHHKFKDLLDKLKALDSSINNKDCVLWFLRALGPEFLQFSSIQLAQNPLPLYSEVVARAKSHELLQQTVLGSSGSINPSAVAFSASENMQFRTSTQARGSHVPSRGAWIPTRGRGGGRRSGGSSSVWSGPAASSYGGRGRRWNPKCQWCNKFGHTAANCHKLASMNRSVDSAHLADAFHSSMTLEEPRTPSSDWYLDSGATSHLTASTSGLDNVAPYSESVHKGGRGPRSM